jgi:hypothetical protein
MPAVVKPTIIVLSLLRVKQRESLRVPALANRAT